MKTVICGFAALFLNLLPIVGCTSPKPDAGAWTPTALGEISADRCLYYTEAEDCRERSGGAIESKSTASKGKCLGMNWGANPADSVTYEFDLARPSPSTILVIRAAFEGIKPQSYDIFIDGDTVKTATLTPTGGFGATEKDWASFSAPLGRINKGTHTLAIKPMKERQPISIDCLALGRVNY